MLEHGGQLRQAAATFGIPLDQWLDLSTGINPLPWPVPALPTEVWNRLPEPDDGLEAIARAYYGCQSLLPLAGSQAAIRMVPRLRPAGVVGILGPVYAEHPQGWQDAGHQVRMLAADTVDHHLEQLDTLVVVHPGNPTGQRWSTDRLLAWRDRLAIRGGLMVVDEAFLDGETEASLARFSHEPGLVVLRSLGKFFGLAGARVGFFLAAPEWCRTLNTLLGPWTVAHPSRWAARQALADRPWQEATRQRLQADSARLVRLLTEHGLLPASGTSLFQWIPRPDARLLQTRLGQQGILVRAFDQPAGLRFGLPGREKDWSRLAESFAVIK